MRRGASAALLAVLLSLAAPLAGAQALIDQFGQAVPPSELGGHWLLVYFGYSRCPDRCPAALAVMTQSLSRLGSAGEAIVPLFVTLDSGYDTPEVLRRYAAHFTPRLRALGGSADAVAEAARSFGVPWRQAGQGQAIDHGLFLYLVGPDGSVVEQFHPDVPAATVAERIRRHLAQSR